MSRTPADKWAVAVYLAGGENVAREMVLSLHDLRDVGLAKRDRFTVLVQFEPGGKPPRLFAFDGVTRESIGSFRTISPGGSPPARLESCEYVLDQGQGGAGAAERLKDFARTARACAGDDPLMLVVSGHGNGAVGEFLGYRGEDPLSLLDLRKALEAGTSGRKVDVLGLDCCNMSMVEVGFELAPYARFMVASEGFILNHGWPYRPILEAIEGRDAEAAAIETAREYAANYSDYGLLDVPSHCAVSRLDDMHLLAEPVRRLSERMIATLEDPDVWRPTVLAHWEAQSFKDEEYVDLADFCARLRAHVGDTEIRIACADVISTVRRVVALNRVNGSAFQFSTGLSIFFPWCHDLVKRRGGEDTPSDLERYAELAFSRETRWAELIDAYLVATRRDPPAPVPELELQSRDPSAQLSLERKEIEMAIKRFPPWNSKGGASRPTPSVKNHPREDAPDASDLPVRRFPPWNSKGSAGRSTVKNHPSKS